MGALAWTGLNLLLIILIGYAWIRVFDLLRRQIGLGLAALFLLSISAFTGNRKSDSEQNKNLLAHDITGERVGNWGTNASTPLNYSNQLDLLVEGQRTESTVQPTGLYTSVSGLVLGHEWKPMGGIVNSGKTGLTYQVVIMHKWNLLGANLYTSVEEYTGSIPTASP